LRRRAIVWAAQYQQRPDALEGGMFPISAWRYWIPSGFPTPVRPRPAGAVPREELPARVVPRDKWGRLLFDWVDLSVDANVKKTEDGSRAGILAIGGIGEDRFVIYDSSRRRDYPELKRDLRRIVNAGGAEIDPYASALDGARWRLTTVLIEDKANGPAAIRELSTGADGGPWPGGISIVAVETGADNKTSRAVVLADKVRAGNWYLLDGAEWLDGGCGDEDDRGFVHEFRPFPNGDRDDRIDCASQCENHHSEDEAAMSNWRGWT
jgi:phage terminase large subunit-like protein